jgi:type II secretory pathway component GspD/PulD (secretin)
MKTKIQLVILALATGGLAAYAQDDNVNPPAAAPPAEVAQATPAPAPAPQPTPAPAPAAPAAPAAAAPVNPNEAVPLIVIDDVPLTDAIRNLARQSNLNFQFDPRVTASNQPNISIRFENVSPQEALMAVLDNYNLKLDKDARFKVSRVTIKDPKAEEPLVTKIVQLKYCDATNMVAMLKPTIDKRSQVLADPRTGQIILSTTEKDMDGALATIEKLDTPTKQVLIEARIVDTAMNPKTVKGINWSGTLAAQKFSIGNNTVGGVVQNPGVIANLAAPSAPMAFLNADGVNAVFSFLNTDTDTKVISTPRAVTLDNQEATLSITKAYPIINITPGSANSPAGSQILYTNLGTILRVTPRIAADDNISLKLVPEVSKIFDKDTQFIEGKVNSANIYAISRIDTKVMIPSGNTLVMGGLMNDDITDKYTKVPIMGDIPVVGWFFRSSDKQRDKRNLIIFVTPTIVQDDAFHLTSSGSDYLKTKHVEQVHGELSAWDSAKPHDWTKPVY